jgi:ABC-type ATPase involved in cell division
MPTVVTKRLSIKCFGDFTFRHSCGEVFQHFQLLVSKTCTKRCFSHFDIPVVKCFDTSNSQYWKPAPKGVFLHFNIPTFRHSCGEVFRHFQLLVSETCTKRCFSHFNIPTFQYSYGEVFRHFQLSVSETLKWSQINGPVFRHFAFQHFGHSCCELP